MSILLSTEPGTHEVLKTERVHFGAGSLERVRDETESRERAFVVTGRKLYDKEEFVLPNKLSDYDVPESDLAKIAGEFGRNEREAREILELSF